MNLDQIIEKGRNFIDDEKNQLTEADLLNGKLAPDMYNFTKQVGYAYFMVLESITNLTGKEAPTFTYDEKNLDELRDSLKRVVEFLDTIKVDDLAHSEEKVITSFLNQDETYDREIYIRQLALPNFFFHITTAYDIFRYFGIPLGKDDYLGL